VCNLFDTTQLCSFADRVFRSDCNTKEVYEEGAKGVALSVVSGINCESTPASYLTPIFFESKYLFVTASVFAYGQTSSGKIYTMIGITEH